MVSLDPVVVPDLVEKKKKKKNKKRRVDEVGDDTLVKPDVENDIPEGESKPKKKKKNKDKVGATEVARAAVEAANEEMKKLKKEKKKTTGSGEVEEEEDNFDVDSGVFKKKFYTPDETTQAMTKVFDKLCSHLKQSPCHFCRLR